MALDLDLTAELAFALELADIADAITLVVYERGEYVVDRKPDRSEVTIADRHSEAAMRAAVEHHFPGHGFFGEEAGVSGDLASPWRWIVDPVDGTSNFVRGIPVWASLIALTHREHGPVAGVVSAPAMNRRWWAATNGGAFVNGRPIQVSTIDTLDDAQVCVTFSTGWDALGLTPRLVALQQDAYRARGFGDFWQHMLVAEGAVEIAIDAIGVQPYDLAAPQVVVEQAGGTFTDRLGRRSYESNSAVSSNGLLHDDCDRTSRARSSRQVTATGSAHRVQRVDDSSETDALSGAEQGGFRALDDRRELIHHADKRAGPINDDGFDRIVTAKDRHAARFGGAGYEVGRDRQHARCARHLERLTSRSLETHFERASQALAPIDESGHRHIDTVLVARRRCGDCQVIAPGDHHRRGQAVDADIEQGPTPSIVEAMVSWVRSWIGEDRADRMNRADVASGGEGEHGLRSRVVRPHVGLDQDPSGRCRRGEHLLGVGSRHRQRLLAEHVLARSERRQDPLPVPGIRQRDVHRVDVVAIRRARRTTTPLRLAHRLASATSSCPSVASIAGLSSLR